MPTLTLRVDCSRELTQQELNELSDIIAQYDDDLVMFDAKYSEVTMLDWDRFLDDQPILSA